MSNRGFKRSDDSMRFGVRINKNIIDMLRKKDININKVILKGFDKWDGKEEYAGTSTGVFGKFTTSEQLSKYIKLKNKRMFIERLLLERLIK